MTSRFETCTVAVILAVTVVGASALILTAPAFTRSVARWAGSAERAGLSEASALDMAESVRRFVVSENPPELPARIDSKPAFTSGAVSHLRDVRAVLQAARVATLVCAVVALLWAAVSATRSRGAAMAIAARGAGLLLLGVVATAIGIAALDFDAFFAAFHGLFFEAGTWQFSSDNLLIQLFPEAFWRVAGMTWGGLVLIGGLVLLGLSRTARCEGKGAGA